MSGLIGSLGYLGETPKILSKLAKDVSETGSREDFEKLKTELDWAIQSRDGLTHEERTAVSETLKDKYFRDFRTGEYLDSLRGIVKSADSRITENPFHASNILMSIFGESMEYLKNYSMKEHARESLEDARRRDAESAYSFFTK